MTPAENLLAKLPGAKPCGEGWAACCPAHEDRKASLTVSEGGDGKALVYCHAGCTVEAVAAAVGLTVRDLMPERTPAPQVRIGKPVPQPRAFPTADAAVADLERRLGPRSALWTYHDAAGNPAGLTVRWDRADGTKDIRPVARHGDGWRIGAMPHPRPLYGLGGLAAAARVVVAEGEKAADAARSLGFVATTSAGGSLAAGKTDWRPLAGKEVWLTPDNDPPGRKYADTVAGILAGLMPAPVVKVVELPGLPDRGDLVDWIAGHGDAAEPDALRAEVEALAGCVEPTRGDETAGRGKNSASWPDPVPLTRAFDPPPFPADVLPPWLRDYVVVLAEEKQVPVDLPGLLALGAAAAGIARKVTVTPWPGWHHEPTNLFVMCCLPPGERKSQTFSAVFAPVKALETDLREREGPAVREAESAFRVAQKRVDHLEAKIAKADDPGERARLADELKAAREEQQAVAVPTLPLLRVDDDTPEMLCLELVRQGGRLLAASPEARTLENIDRYSDKPNMDVFLKGHAGDDIRSGRVGRGRDAVDRAALTCAYSPQPCVLEGLGATPEMRGRGFLARWFYGLPASAVGFRKVRAAAVPGAVRAAYEAALTRMWQVGYSAAGPDAAHDLALTPEGQAELHRFEEWKEVRLRPGGELAGCGGWGNKLGGLCVRVCGILHVADGIAAGGGWATTPIPAGVVRRAVRLCREYAIPHALAAFDRMGATAAVSGARAVLRWLAGRPAPTADFSKRDAFNGCRGTFDGVDDLNPALELLERHALIRPKPHPELRPGPGRKPSPVFEVHSAAFDIPPAAQNTHNAHNSRGDHPAGCSAESADCASDGGRQNCAERDRSRPDDGPTDFSSGQDRTRDPDDRRLFPDLLGLPD